MSRQSGVHITFTKLPATTAPMRGNTGELYIPSPAASAPFERSKITQALIDGLAMFVGISLLFATAGSIVVSLFLLFSSF